MRRWPAARAQRVERLVVGRAPKLRPGFGAHDARRDPDLAVHVADAAGQDIARHRGRRVAARLGRHDEVLGTVEHDEDLLGQRGRELGDAVCPAEHLERLHDHRRPAIGQGRSRCDVVLETRDLAPLPRDDGDTC